MYIYLSIRQSILPAHHISLLISGSLHQPIPNTPCMHGSAMTWDLELRLLMIHHWDGTFETWICSWNAFQVHHLKSTAGLAIIVVVLCIILLTVLFAPLLHAMLEDHNQLLLITSNEPTRYAKISIGQTVTKTTANFHTDVRSVPGLTLPRAAWQRGSPSPLNPLRGPHYNRSCSNVNYVTILTESLLDS